MICDVATGVQKFRLSGHAGAVHSVGFSTDNLQLVSTASDGVVKLWSIKDRRLLVTFVALPNNDWVTITPEGFFDASENGAKLLSVVQGLMFTRWTSSSAGYTGRTWCGKSSPVIRTGW